MAPMTHDAMLTRVRGLIAGIRERAAAAEEARTLPRESVDALIAAGITRILIPPRFGGYGLSLDTWFEVVREIGKADASHAWCASLMIHHPHYVGQFAEDAQKAVWSDGPDVPIAASILPFGQVTPAPGGYRITGEFPFASGVNHSRWVIVGGMVSANGPPEWTFFLVPPGDYQVIDTWFTGAMRATGSNTIVCENVVVPESRTLRLSALREGQGPGGALHANPIFRAPFITYAPLTFVTPMLGAAQGAYEIFRDWTRNRRGTGGVALAEITSFQTRLGRAAADLDAAEMLLRRAVGVPQAPTPASLALRARSMRDFSRASEFCVGVVDTLIAMSGTAAFAGSHPIQRAWRDIHFAAMHVSLNAEQNFAHFGRTEFGLPRDPHQPFF
ncbi:MAG TPA: acyl-CoA dehydrogenase family protein [Xanthobacteraceae bacterium]|nr:acyl-CoA dehydrogenase family protein [Xanthobacteraceae bacterium]